MAISIIKCTKSHRKMREQKETLSPDGTVLNIAYQIPIVHSLKVVMYNERITNIIERS